MIRNDLTITLGQKMCVSINAYEAIGKPGFLRLICDLKNEKVILSAGKYYSENDIPVLNPEDVAQKDIPNRVGRIQANGLYIGDEEYCRSMKQLLELDPDRCYCLSGIASEEKVIFCACSVIGVCGCE